MLSCLLLTSSVNTAIGIITTDNIRADWRVSLDSALERLSVPDPSSIADPLCEKLCRECALLGQLMLYVDIVAL